MSSAQIMCGRKGSVGAVGGAAVQKDPFIPIRRVRCPTQRNPVELNTIYTTLSSPPPWDINLRNHQEQAYNMPTMKILVKYGRKFLRSSCPSKLNVEENRILVPMVL